MSTGMAVIYCRDRVVLFLIFLILETSTRSFSTVVHPRYMAEARKAELGIRRVILVVPGLFLGNSRASVGI